MSATTPSSSVIRHREGEFSLSELFFSRTDGRGVIASGNCVFQRVSGFDWDELIGAPHKLVRHDDMPRAVFWLLWDSLKKGRPIGAYVKNRTKSGGSYWVFAVVMPLGTGYISVRMKPTSEIFDKVRDLYPTIRAAERDAGRDLAPEDSADTLHKAIIDHGFQDYTAFMGRALTAELMSRDKSMGAPVDDRLQAFLAMAETVTEIFSEVNDLYADFRRIEQIPVNLRLQASRCEASGGPVSVISANYSNLAREALAFAGRFTEFGRQVIGQIDMGLFLMGAARLQRETVIAFEANKEREDAIDREREIGLLRDHMTSCGNNARDAVVGINEKCEAFIEDSRRMRRFIGGLDVTRVTCRIETGWLPDDDGGFHDIICKLDAFHEVVEKRMKKIDSLNEAIMARANTLLNRRRSPDKSAPEKPGIAAE